MPTDQENLVNAAAVTAGSALNAFPYVAMANGAITLLQTLIPIIIKAFQGTPITIAEQNEVRAKADAIRTGKAFEGPEFKLSTDPS